MNHQPDGDSELRLDPVNDLLLDASVGPLSIALIDILKRRRTERAFSPAALPRMQLSRLLWAAFGCNSDTPSQRTAPSKHHTLDIDVYLVTPGGHYRFDPVGMRLVRTGQDDLRPFSGAHACVLEAPLSLVYVALPGEDAASERQAAALSIGHISQNVYLLCAAEGLAAYAHTDFNQAALEQALGLEAGQQVMLVQTVGRPATPRAPASGGYDE